MKKYWQPFLGVLLSICVLALVIGINPMGRMSAEGPHSPPPPGAPTPTPSPETLYLDTPLASWTAASPALPDPVQTKHQALLHYGFQDEAPYLAYYDAQQNLQLELYFHQQEDTGCGFRYRWDEVAGAADIPAVHGFSFSSTAPSSEQDVWGGIDPFSMTSVWGDTGADRVSDYQEAITYDDNGNIMAFRSTGISPDLPGAERGLLVDVAFTYREDGTLDRKDYHHNPQFFSTTYTGSTLFYDESQRLEYAESYITHGALEHYYLYAGGGSEPSDCLILDWNSGAYDPQLVHKAQFEPHTYEVRARLHDEMPEYRFVATGRVNGTDNWVIGFVLGLEVYDEKGAPILTANFIENAEGYYVYNQMLDTMGLHVVDVNFDGYRDVIILNTFSGAHSNTWYDCWLWDVETAAFVPSPSFSDICNPAIDREKECIYSAGGGGAAYWGGSIYEFLNGEFVMTHDLYTSWSGLQETALVDGEMKTVREASWGAGWGTDVLAQEREHYKSSDLWQLEHPRWYWFGGHHADQWLE